MQAAEKQTWSWNWPGMENKDQKNILAPFSNLKTLLLRWRTLGRSPSNSLWSKGIGGEADLQPALALYKFGNRHTDTMDTQKEEDGSREDTKMEDTGNAPWNSLKKGTRENKCLGGNLWWYEGTPCFTTPLLKPMKMMEFKHRGRGINVFWRLSGSFFRTEVLSVNQIEQFTPRSFDFLWVFKKVKTNFFFETNSFPSC